MNILLVNPSLTQEQVGHYNAKVEKVRGRYPSLGLFYIAAVLEKEGHIVELIDFDIETDPQKRLRESLIHSKPDILGIHVMTWTFHQANKIAMLAREIIPSIIVIAGGAAVTSSPLATIKHSVFDCGVIGEGEETVVDLVNAIRSGLALDGVPGIIFRKDGNIKQNAKRPFIHDLDSLPLPARHLVDLSRYCDVFTQKQRFATVVTSRGCPYRCIYCDRENRMGNTWRSFSNRRIIEEITSLKELNNIDEVMFFDDEFIVNRDKVAELCDMILAKELHLTWECRARVDLVDRKLLALMRKSGCYRIRFGFESGDDGILDRLKKGITIKQSLECARLVKEAGIEIFGYFMLGCPGETRATMEKTLNLAFEIAPDFAIFSKAILIPGSELFEWAVSENLIDKDYWDLFFQGKVKNTAPAISTKGLPESEVDMFIRRANKQFYFRPGFIARRLSKIRSFSQLQRQAVMARSLLFG